MQVTYDFSGRVALITGAASGVGRATALAFARANAKVAVADIADEEGRETVRLIRAAGGTAEFFAVDVRDEQKVKAMVDAVVETFGRLDFAHNNAGIEVGMTPVADADMDGLRRMLDINLCGVAFGIKAEVPHMRKNGGAIVNTASALGLIGGYRGGLYAATKHAVVGLTKSAAVDYADKGIRINCVCPGPIDTPFIAEFPPAVIERMLYGTPIGRVADPAEIAQAVLWLCSDGSSYVCGHALAVDGGIATGAVSTKMEDLWEAMAQADAPAG